MSHPTIAQRIEAYRRAHGLTQAELASLILVSTITVVRWENGSSRPSPLAAERLDALGVASIERSDTKAISSPRIADQALSADDLRSAVRSTLCVDGEDQEFDPAPYVVNGPEDQLAFYEKLFDLQEEPLAKGLISPDRIALASYFPGLGVETSLSALERPKVGAKSWRGTYGPHGFHRYVGRFPPHLVRSLLNHFAMQPGQTVCDPFLGSGTTLVEARLLGINGYGLDVCPLSTMISRAKTQFPEDFSDLESLGERFREFYEGRWAALMEDSPAPSHQQILDRDGNEIDRFANIEKWFTPEALLGTSIAVEFASTLTGYTRDLFVTCVSAQLRSVGNVDVDVVRAEYRKSPRENVDVLGLVLRRLRSATREIGASLRTHQMTIGKPESIAIEEMSVLRAEIEPGSLDAIVTSPPYGVESLSYLRTHLLSYRALEPLLRHDVYGWNSEIIGSEYLAPGDPFESEHKAASFSPAYAKFFIDEAPEVSGSEAKRTAMMMGFFDDMTETSRRLSSWLAIGGRLAFVVGNKRLGNRVIPTDVIMQEIFNDVGLRVDSLIAHKLKTNNSNSEVPWQERVIQEENVILCTKVAHAAS